MKQLLYKEYKLCLVGMVPLFYTFTLMLLVPSYPYLISAFFTCNSIFFLFKQSVTNGDPLFTALLPVPKGDMVRARVRFVILIQMTMLLLLMPMILINHRLYPAGNPAGTDGSLSLLASVLVLFALFNGVFIPGFYRTVYKTDKPFLISLVAVFGWIFLWEGCMIASDAAQASVPLFAWVKSHLDGYPTTDGAWRAQLVALAVGAAVYGSGAVFTTRKAIRNVERVDL